MITPNLLKNLYRMMQTIRQVEESLVAPIQDGTIRCPVHLYTGQEATAAGVCSGLTTDDYVFGTHRSHGHYLAKGGSIDALVAEVYCRETGCSGGRGGSMHLIDPQSGMLGSAPIVGGTISLALGAALAAQIRGDRRVTVSFFGDGATGEGVLYEAMNLAALRKLPIVFACENNLYSTHMPIREIRVGLPIVDIARPFGITAEQVDGNDVIAVHEAALRAFERCRSGEGPVFVEFLTYRMRGHVGPNDNIQGTQTDIRPEQEVVEWRRLDPILRLEQEILRRGHATRDELETIATEVARDVDLAHQRAIRSPRPSAANWERHVFF